MNKLLVAGIAVLLVFLLLVFGAWYLQSGNDNGAGNAASIVIGTPPVESSALVYIADDQGFFHENGLNVTVKNYTTALAAVADMENGSADISISSEYPIVTEGFENDHITVIGTIDKYQSQYLVGRKDRGIQNVSDLKGKKIGVHMDGISQFYLGRFLTLHGLSLQDVTLVDVPPSKYADAIANGSIDAVQVRQIDVGQVEMRLADNYVTWPAQSDQPTYMVMACQDSWAAGHPGQAALLLKSLAQAEEYNIDHPSEAKAIVQKRLNLSDTYISTVWAEHQFSLTLDQSLITAMEDEGRWMINNNLTDEKTIPDYRDHVYLKAIDSVSPGSENVIR
jgi:NitT/TauT family transport system substrate-binding protein